MNEEEYKAWPMNSSYYRKKMELITEKSRDNPFMDLWDLVGDVDTGEYNDEEIEWKANLELLKTQLFHILSKRVEEEIRKV